LYNEKGAIVFLISVQIVLYRRGQSSHWTPTHRYCMLPRSG